MLNITISTQKLTCQTQHHVLSYSISTAKKGAGQKKGSYQTPLGWHIVRAKIGEGMPLNTIFKARRAQGVLTPERYAENPEGDWILTRILWLSGLEVGKNRMGDCDTMQRYIYIHGCPDACPMGIPLSQGCIRMRNEDIITLFDSVKVGTRVLISP